MIDGWGAVDAFCNFFVGVGEIADHRLGFMYPSPTLPMISDIEALGIYPYSEFFVQYDKISL